eukprot:COSAG02_NODE_1458_length_12476_cov_6.772841_7_plen_94_part_00
MRPVRDRLTVCGAFVRRIRHCHASNARDADSRLRKLRPAGQRHGSGARATVGGRWAGRLVGRSEGSDRALRGGGGEAGAVGGRQAGWWHVVYV